MLENFTKRVLSSKIKTERRVFGSKIHITNRFSEQLRSHISHTPFAIFIKIIVGGAVEIGSDRKRPRIYRVLLVAGEGLEPPTRGL